MKKFAAILMALVLCIGFAACGAKTEDVTTTTEAPEGTGFEGMANPVTEVESLEKLMEMTGAKFSTPGVMGVSDEAYTITDCGDFKIAAYKYTVNDKKIEIRFCDNMTDDISGYYVDGDTAFAGVEGDAEKVMENAALARWYTVDGQYVFIIEAEGLSKELFEDLAQEARDVSLGENSDSALSAFYASISGEYADSVSQRATLIVTAEEDEAEFTISWANSADETVEWKMDVTKGEDSLLYYTDCEKTVYSADGETTEYEDGEGYFEYVDGKLLWTGAAEENCKACVFEIIPMD